MSKKNFMLVLPEELHKQLKVISVVNGVYMTDYIIEAIKEKMSKESK